MLSGQTAIVTGGSRGIGRAICLALAGHGARFGDPDEIAFMVAFLAGPESKFITGQCFGVNGGSVMQ